MFQSKSWAIPTGILVALCLAVVVALVLSSVGVLNAASTTKSLSTNYTLVNLGTSTANVVAQYLLDTGATWTAPADSTSFQIAPNGGQKIVRQYLDTMTPSSGRGSAVISSDQPLAAVVQIQARGQTPTNGAYSGFNQTSDTFYVPLAMRRLATASGTGNTQIMVQNAGTSAINVSIQMVGAPGVFGNYTKNVTNLAPGATYYYDLDDESSANLPAGWYGAAVVSSSGNQLAVVSNLFSGVHAVQTFNAFRAAGAGTTWLAPLFTSRLANGLSTVVAFQNLSGSTIAAGAVTLACTKDPASPGAGTLNVPNASSVPNNAAYYFNPVTDSTNFPSGWYGSCRLTSSSGNVVAFVQMRQIGTDNNGAYEAINAGGTDTKVLVPLVSKRLTNGFATVANVQNLNNSTAANATFTYVPSAEYIAGGGSPSNIVVGPYQIPAGGSVQHNHRLPGAGSGTGQHNLPDRWYGTLTVTADQPINGIVQLTNIIAQPGDTFMVHNAFTLP